MNKSVQHDTHSMYKQNSEQYTWLQANDAKYHIKVYSTWVMLVRHLIGRISDH